MLLRQHLYVRSFIFQGYVKAWWEEGNILNLVLLKYFGKGLKGDWIREVEVVKGLSCTEEPHTHLLHYRWHAKGKMLIWSLCILLYAVTS